MNEPKATDTVKARRWFATRLVILAIIFVLHLAPSTKDAASWDSMTVLAVFSGVFLVFGTFAAFASSRKPTSHEMWHDNLLRTGIGPFLIVHMLSWIMAAASFGLVLSWLVFKSAVASTAAIDITAFVALRLSLIVSGFVLYFRTRRCGGMIRGHR